jgi:hypothetical protein
VYFLENKKETGTNAGQKTEIVTLTEGAEEAISRAAVPSISFASFVFFHIIKGQGANYKRGWRKKRQKFSARRLR